MKLIKILAEEFPMFNQYDDADAGLHGENPTGGDISSTSFDSIEGKPEDQDNKEDCVCTCECPCCSAKRDGDLNDILDFSSQETGANLEKPEGLDKEDGDDEFRFNI